MRLSKLSKQSSYIIISFPSENDRSLFHSRLSRHIHKFSYSFISYFEKKKPFDYVGYYCICKYPIRKFCTPIHYIICNIYLWGFFSVDWMAPHSLEMRKSFLMKCSSGTLQNLSYFELKNPVISSFRIPK